MGVKATLTSTVIPCALYKKCLKNKFVSVKTTSRSVIYIRNNSGPKLDTWGTPQFIDLLFHIVLLYNVLVLHADISH